MKTFRHKGVLINIHGRIDKDIFEKAAVTFVNKVTNTKERKNNEHDDKTGTIKKK